MGEKLIRIQNLNHFLDPEPYFILSALLLLAWAFYKLFLREVSTERHRNLRGHFKNILHHFLVLSTAFSAYTVLMQSEMEWAVKSVPYVGLLTLLSGMIVFVKTSRLIILQYMFLGSMRAGVPVLIVNIFSLALSVLLALWVANQIFGIQVAPLLATSAAFSIILGLALQDTLGNLFAGISLQLDKSFEIGDWLEIQVGITKVTGQVKEISWRATLLIGLSDEMITIPNRTLANSQISNFTGGESPIVRSQLFRIPFHHNPQAVKEILNASIKNIPEVKKYPEAFTYIYENTESWVSYKLVYFLEDYGAQWRVGDLVIASGLQYLQANKIDVSSPRIEVIKT